MGIEVIFKGKNGFVMAGDHQWHLERNLPYSQILGVADAIERNGKRISRNYFFFTNLCFDGDRPGFPPYIYMEGS